MRDKVSGAIAIPKASWGCAPALPNRIRMVFQEHCFMWNMKRMILRKNNFQHPAKGGSTPAFACQRAAIAPLPCLNFCLCFSLIFQIRTGKFKNVRLQQGKQIANWIPIKFASQMWATRPHLASIFEKLLDQKTFYLPAARDWKHCF